MPAPIDYVTKPFGMNELLARTASPAPPRRRTDTDDLSPVVNTDHFTIDLVKGHVIGSDGETIHLTPKEWGIVACLARRPGQLVLQRDSCVTCGAPSTATKGTTSVSSSPRSARSSNRRRTDRTTSSPSQASDTDSNTPLAGADPMKPFGCALQASNGSRPRPRHATTRPCSRPGPPRTAPLGKHGSNDRCRGDGNDAPGRIRRCAHPATGATQPEHLAADGAARARRRAARRASPRHARRARGGGRIRRVPHAALLPADDRRPRRHRGDDRPSRDRHHSGHTRRVGAERRRCRPRPPQRTGSRHELPRHIGTPISGEALARHARASILSLLDAHECVWRHDYKGTASPVLRPDGDPHTRGPSATATRAAASLQPPSRSRSDTRPADYGRFIVQTNRRANVSLEERRAAATIATTLARCISP